MYLPLVSVIITTYNRPAMLLRSILSVMSQTYINIEIVVVDDCSDSNMKNQVDSICEDFVYVRNMKNIGVSASRNKGFLASSGEYVSFLDDDDEILPEKIEKQINIFLENKTVDAVYCGSLKKYSKSKFEILPVLKGNILPEVLSSCPNAIHTLLLKRDCFDLVGGFDEDIIFYEDFDFWIRLSRKFTFGFVPECLVVYHMHGCQMSTNFLEAISGIDYILDKHGDVFMVNKKYLYSHLRRQASRCAVNNEYKLFYVYIFKSIKFCPFYAGSYIHLFLSLASRKFHKKLISYFGIKNIDGIITY